VPICELFQSLVGKENGPRSVQSQQLGDDFHGSRPVHRVFLAGGTIHFFQTPRLGLHQLEADAIAAVLQLLPAARLPRFVAALGDGHIDDPPAGLSQQAERPAADDDFVIWVRGEDEGHGSVRREGGARAGWKTTKRPVFALAGEARVFGDEMQIRIHASNAGRLAVCRDGSQSRRYACAGRQGIWGRWMPLLIG